MARSLQDLLALVSTGSAERRKQARSKTLRRAIDRHDSSAETWIDDAYATFTPPTDWTGEDTDDTDYASEWTAAQDSALWQSDAERTEAEASAPTADYVTIAETANAETQLA